MFLHCYTQNTNFLFSFDIKYQFFLFAVHQRKAITFNIRPVARECMYLNFKILLVSSYIISMITMAASSTLYPRSSYG